MEVLKLKNFFVIHGSPTFKVASVYGNSIFLTHVNFPHKRMFLLQQSFVVMGLMSLMFSAGVGFGTATVMMPQLKKKRDEILVDDTMSSWICKFTCIF